MDSIRCQLISSHFPKEVAQIVDQYLRPPNYSRLDPLKFNDQGVCTNPDMRELSKLALADIGCPTKYKTYILNKAFDNEYTTELKLMIRELISEGYQLNLDGIDFIDLDLSGLDMSGGKFSAVDAELSGLDLTGANIDGANLKKANIRWVKLTGTSMLDVETEQTSILADDDEISDVVMNDKTRRGIKFTLIESSTTRT